MTATEKNPLKFSEPFLQEQVPLKNFTTFQLGGKARFFLKAKSLTCLRQGILWAKVHSLPFFILGKGSNSLFSEKGYPGLVILNHIKFFHQEENEFYVGAGNSFSLLGSKTAKLGFEGLEFAVGIPASVGGAVFMNAGANQAATFDCLKSVDFMDEQGVLHHYKKSQLKYDYRFSSFQQLPGAIVAARFELKKNPLAKQRQLDIITYRKQTQPYTSPSAGCIFKNPQGFSAGRLIEQAGLKGYQMGGASVSLKHANFIINQGDATLEEVQKLAEHIKKAIEKKEGFSLEAEVYCIDEQGKRSLLC